MNVYQKILVKLYDVTGGKNTEVVDLRELVKAEGFYPSYRDIFKQMNQLGWIAETGREDIIKITHWGVKEAKKLRTGVVDDSQALRRKANRLEAGVRELLVMTGEFAGDVSEEHFKQVEKKFGEIQDMIGELKANF